jgi:hypothetical protein
MMSFFRSTRVASKAPKFVPRCEALEGRDCPSSGVSAAVFGHTLRVRGDANANTVTITDDGHGNVTATIDGKPSVTGSGITKILVDTKAGNDTVKYTLTGALAGSEAVFIDLGKGTDTATVDATPGVTAGKLRVRVEGHGTDTINSTFGSVAAGASVEGSFEGGRGNDTINTTFSGTLNGSLRLNSEGHQGNDTIATNVTINKGSTGKLDARVDGDRGTNNLTLNVVDNTADPTTGKTGLARLKARIEANRNDTVTHSSNVTVDTDD